MLDMGFIDEVKNILSLVPENCRISLFSATLGPEIRELADAFIPDRILVLQEPRRSRQRRSRKRSISLIRRENTGTFSRFL